MKSRYSNGKILRMRWLLETPSGYNKFELTSVNTEQVYTVVMRKIPRSTERIISDSYEVLMKLLIVWFQ